MGWYADYRESKAEAEELKTNKPLPGIEATIKELQRMIDFREDQLKTLMDGEHRYVRMLIHGEIEGMTLAKDLIKKVYLED